MRRGRRILSRRRLLALGRGAAAAALGGARGLRRKVRGRVAKVTQLPSFTAAPPLLPHDAARERRTLYVARGGASPDANVDAVLSKLGGMAAVVGTHDVVILKVSAQWWNQGMTNVAAVKRVIEHVLERSGFAGEVIVFENTHFRMASGSGLSRAWVHPSERNVDVAGWTKLGDLIPHFQERGAPVSFVGLVDGGPSALSGEAWHDPSRTHGVYGGDGRGPIAPGELRDGYHWDFARAFRLERSWVDAARTPLTWPRFTSPHSGLVVDLRDGVLRREDGRLVPAGRKLTWINMTTANEHGSTGMTAACKSTMGVLDMSAGALGTHPLVRDYVSVHYFGRGSPSATWRMAGPLAHLAREVREPDLVLTVAEWVAFAPPGFDGDRDGDVRHSARSCTQLRTIVAGKDPAAVDTWVARNVLAEVESADKRRLFDLDNPDALLTKFLRYYRQVRGPGNATIDPALIDVV